MHKYPVKNIDAKDKNGRTALMMAVLCSRKNNAATVRMLIDAGTDVNLTDNDGQWH